MVLRKRLLISNLSSLPLPNKKMIGCLEVCHKRETKFRDVELLKLNDLLEEARSSTKQVIKERDGITKNAKNM